MENPEQGKTRKMTRKEARALLPALRRFIMAGDFEGFKNALTCELGIPLGSQRFRSLEALFWQAVAERKKIEQQKL